jgi:6,7-dimethyl-8-ribityllumazine synthase
MNRTSGKLSAGGRSYAIVVSRFNEFITESLLKGAVGELVRLGAAETDIHVYEVPGTFEMTGAARRIAARADIDAIICLGAVIRGGTPHFDHVATAVARGLAGLADEARKPLGFGILTTDTVEQAVERAGVKMGNKGAEAARAAVELADLYAQLDRAP